MLNNYDQYTCKHYAALQASAGLSNSQAATFFAVNISTVKRWRNGEKPIPMGAFYALNHLILNKQQGGEK